MNSALPMTPRRPRGRSPLWAFALLLPAPLAAAGEPEPSPYESSWWSQELRAAARPEPVGWRYDLDVQFWAPLFDGDLRVRSLPPVKVDKDLGDLFDDFSVAPMVRFDAQNSATPWGVTFDAAYIDLEDDGDTTRSVMRVSVFEADVTYRPCPEDRYQLLAGLRFWNFKAKVDIEGTEKEEVSRTWIDPVVGVRGTTRLRDQWSFQWRGDVGGFSTGTRLTWQGLALLRYEFARRNYFTLGWRHLEVDRDSGEFDVDVLFSGPMVGLTFGF